MPARTPNGRVRCEVQQLALTGLPDAPQLEPGGGWFYDDFSSRSACSCITATTCNSIVFVPNLPPSGMVLRLECAETRVLDARDAGDDPAACRVP